MAQPWAALLADIDCTPLGQSTTDLYKGDHPPDVKGAQPPNVHLTPRLRQNCPTANPTATRNQRSLSPLQVHLHKNELSGNLCNGSVNNEEWS